MIQLPNLLSCPELKFLYLETIFGLSISDDFFSGMPKLQVIHLEGIRSNELPKSLISLEQLAALFIKNCELKNTFTVGYLKNLEILVLSDLWHYMGMKFLDCVGYLSHLRLLDLRGSELEIPPGVLSRLTGLEELYIEGRNDKPGDAATFQVEELKYLCCLTALHVRVPNAAIEVLSKSTLFRNLQRYNIVFGNRMKELYLPESSRTLQVISRTDTCLKAVIQQFWIIEILLLEGQNISNICCSSLTFANLRILKVEFCLKIKSFVSVSIAKCLTVLEEISIGKCEKMEQIIGNEEDVEGVITMPRLKILKLRRLENLWSFYSGNHTFHFPLLERIFISECPNFISFSSGAFTMPSLERLVKDERILECKDNELNGLIREKEVRRFFTFTKKLI